MAPRAPSKTKALTLEQRLDRKLRDHPHGQLLKEWLAEADNVILACRDEGHHWDTFGASSTFATRESGVWAVSQGCLRLIDGLACQVLRVRFPDPYSGELAMTNRYDYTKARAYPMPLVGGKYSVPLTKDTRALIRLARMVRSGQGEETS